MTSTKLLIDDFLGLEPMSSLEKKKLDLSNKLNALMVHCGFRQKDLAQLKKWKKSYVSKILSGEQNLTIKTILEFSETLGYDFDIVLFKKNTNIEIRQPWSHGKLISNVVEISVKKVDLYIVDEHLEKLTETMIKHHHFSSFNVAKPQPIRDVLPAVKTGAMLEFSNPVKIPQEI